MPFLPNIGAVLPTGAIKAMNVVQQTGTGRNKPKVLAVIVTYYPEHAQLRQLCRRMSKQVAHTLIIDNTEHAQTVLEAPPAPEATLLSSGTNDGIAAAQNRGIEWAESRGYTHVLLLDQDSLPDEDMVSALLREEQKLIGQGIGVGAVGPQAVAPNDPLQREPFVVKTRRGFARRTCNQKDTPSIRVAYLHASGTLLRIAAVQKIGLLDHTLFIDLVDIEWGFRAAALHMDCYGVCTARISHQVGEKRRLGFFRIVREISVHAPSRTYYQARNLFLLARADYIPYSWLLTYGGRNLLLRGGLLLLTGPQRSRRCAYLLLGLWHGILGKKGPLNAT